MNGMNPKVDGYVRKSSAWRDELGKLRTILIGCQLTEEVKWRHPCYTFGTRNIVITGRFKEYCALTFVKGALLKDLHGILKKPGENTRIARVIRFTGIQQILNLESILRDYIYEAIEVEKAGLKLTLITNSDLIFPAEFKKKLEDLPALKTAFEALTPGRQRAYNLYFSAAKQSKTRLARVEKCMGRILRGKGFNDL